MRIATKIGTYTIIQTQPPDDGDAAVYHLRSPTREPLEKLRQLTGLSHEILPPAPTDAEFHLVITRNDIFEILATLAETIDYDHFDPTPKGS
jgi:hypothetical protein